jgi:hypothetical protein
MTPKIIELVIQDDDIEAGLDGIALVEMPAHEANFEYFSQEPIEEKCSHYVLADEKIPQIIQMFHAFGEPQGLLEKEGFYIAEVRNVGKKEFATIISNPNDSSAQDTPDVRFRYKYVGPRDEKNRTFCAEMMKAQRVFRIEDIMEMSNLSVNEVGPDGYDIFTWRGSFNCRHRWVQLIYKAEGRIVNNTLVEKGLEDTDDMPGPDTRTTATIAAGNTPPRVGFSTEGNPNVSALAPYVDQVTKKVVKKPVLASLPMFKNREDAEAMAEAIGCKGSHSMQYGTEVLWMPCETHEPEGDEEHPDMYGLEDACWEGYEPIGLKDDGSPNCVPINEEMNADGNYVTGDFASYDDYPSLIRKNAQAALDYIERTGNPNNCMTQVGKVRAQQLAQGKPISIETVKRMKSFISRHKENLDVSKSYDDGCAKLAVDAWGGVEALPWVERTIEQYESMSKFSSEEAVFSVFNNEQRLLLGPAMIPDKMIIRRNEITGEIYYVYFTAETIKKLQQKFMQEKLLDKTNIEHGRKFLSGVDVVESWIVEDQTKDKQQVFGMNYPKGTWMVSVKVNDDATWGKVKDGKLKGFSVQGYFLEKAKFNAETHKVLDEIKNILKEIK